MKKKYLFLFLFGLAVTIAKAQTTDTVLMNRMGDFDMATLNSDPYAALLTGEKILPDTAKLEPKIRVNFFAKLAKAYDDVDQDAIATIYYEKVAAAAPDYFVAQRALGYIYNDRAEEIQVKLHTAPKGSPAYNQLLEGYKKAVRKALPYLEKAQACDPDDDTLDLIRTLYMNIHDEQGLSSLSNRLPELAKKCVDLLDDK